MFTFIKHLIVYYDQVNKINLEYIIPLDNCALIQEQRHYYALYDHMLQ